MSLYEISVHALRARARNLEDDLENWSARASKKEDLGLHDSQMKRLRVQIESTLGRALENTPLSNSDPPPFDGSISDVVRMRKAVGSVHLIWDFFRDKLAQRDVRSVAAHLDAADDLAWACYKPFVDAAAKAPAGTVDAKTLKEPPLVFYGTDRAPFAQARTKTLRPPGLDSKDTRLFSAALRRMPVPVISMPWSVANRVPELVLIGHETGHIVAEDLGLADRMADIVAGLAYDDDRDGHRAGAWKAWADEVWADVFGTVATGKAFVAGLAAELAGDVNDVRLATIDLAAPGAYPTASLRMAICETVLDRLGIARDATWHDTFGIAVGDSRDFVGDVDLVVDALLDQTWAALGDKTLVDVLPWSPADEQTAAELGQAFLGEFELGVPFDVRLWIAAAMSADRADPAKYEALDLDAVIASAIGKGRDADDQVRSASDVRRATLPELDLGELELPADIGHSTATDRFDVGRPSIGAEPRFGGGGLDPDGGFDPTRGDAGFDPGFAHERPPPSVHVELTEAERHELQEEKLREADVEAGADLADLLGLT